MCQTQARAKTRENHKVADALAPIRGDVMTLNLEKKIVEQRNTHYLLSVYSLILFINLQLCSKLFIRQTDLDFKVFLFN